MRYYLWENDKNDGDAFIYGGWPPDLGLSFYTGGRIAGGVPPILIKMNERSQGNLTDNVLLTGRGRVLSTRLLQLLAANGVDNIESFPCTIHNTVTGEIHTQFHVVNVVGKVACVDHVKSRAIYAAGSETDIIGFDSLVLDETKIGDFRLFVLAEMPVQIVAHEEIVRAIEAAGITGLAFAAQELAE